MVRLEGSILNRGDNIFALEGWVIAQNFLEGGARTD